MFPLQVLHQVVDGICGRESVRFENCAKLMSTSQFGQLKQVLVEFVKESVSGEFNKANVSKPHKINFLTSIKCNCTLDSTICLYPVEVKQCPESLIS